MTDDRGRVRAKARAAAEEALRLSPTLGEAHMALGLCLYWGDKDYDAALKEFSRSPRRLRPMMPTFFITSLAFIAGRDAGANRSQPIERALSLDPRNRHIAMARRQQSPFGA